MAQLTWRDVAAPDLGRAADILSSAANSFGAGTSSIAGALRQTRADQMERRSSAALPILAGVASEADVAGALAQVNGMVRPQDMTPELQKAIMGLRSGALGYERDRAGTATIVGQEGRASTEFGRRITREDQEAAAAGNLVRLSETAYGQPTDTSAVGLIKGFEGYSDKPYWDVNAHRLGYGSDTITNPDGTFRAVQEGDVVDQAGADRDLDRRINSEFVPRLKKAIGEDTYNNLSPNQQAALTSITYNYGSLPDSVAAAVATGDPQKVASAISALGSHNNGINANRRNTEAQVFLGGAGASRVSDIIPENNALPASFWLGQVEGNFNADGERYNRDRSRRADSASDIGSQLALSITQQLLPGDSFAKKLAEATQDPQVFNAAMAAYQNLPNEDLQALPFDPSRTTTPDCRGRQVGRCG